MAGAAILSAAEEERLRRHVTLQRRVLREASEPLMIPDKEFVSHYRLTKADFMLLCDDVIPLLPATQRTHAIRSEIRVLAALAFYANGCYQRNVGAYHHLGMAQTTVSACLKAVTDALNHPSILAKYIKFPGNRTQREVIARRFMEVHRFHGVVGCLDGTHVAIIRPSSDEEAYFNRKQYHSLNVLIICDADLRIMHVDASFGGQSHDSHIWNSSQVKAYMESLHDSGEVCWLLGDSGYAQRPWVMTPIVNATNPVEENYTTMHVRTRNVVERCIGVLKSRWRCLLAHRVLHYAPVKAGKIVNACVVLHNLILHSRASIDEEVMQRDRALQPSQLLPVEQSHQVGRTHNIDSERLMIAQRLWRNRNTS